MIKNHQPKNLAEAEIREVRVSMTRQGLHPIHLSRLTGLNISTIRNYVGGVTSSRIGFETLRKAVGIERPSVKSAINHP